MKIDAEIQWLIDKPEYGIACGSIENVAIDLDYLEDDVNDVEATVEYELSEKYGITCNAAYNAIDGDFVIKNIDDIMEA